MMLIPAIDDVTSRRPLTPLSLVNDLAGISLVGAGQDLHQG